MIREVSFFGLPAQSCLLQFEGIVSSTGAASEICSEWPLVALKLLQAKDLKYLETAVGAVLGFVGLKLVRCTWMP